MAEFFMAAWLRWSQTRLIATLLIPYVLFAEVMSLLLAHDAICIVNPGKYGSYYADNNECPPLHRFFMNVAAGLVEKLADANNITMLATIAIAGFTGTLWWSTYKMQQATLISINLARDEFNSSHRPEIRIKHVWLLNEFFYDHLVKVRVVCVNIGTSNAHLIDYGADFLVVRIGTSFPPDHIFPFNRPITSILKPGISGPFPDFDYVLSERDEIEIRNERSKFYCLGYLHYADGSGGVRTTAFCRELVLNTSTRSGGRFVRAENSDYEYED